MRLPALPLLLFLLASSASALPGMTAAPYLVARSPASPTDVWVTVDESGVPSTVTPVATVISGSTTILSAAPHDLTASVFTVTDQGAVSTTTATSGVAATATDAAGAGSFSACQNTAGDFAPFCQPANNETLNPGQTYYVTWDPTYFTAKAPNTTVMVTGWYLNATTGARTTQAFTSASLAAGWGFYQWAVDTSVLNGASAVNVTLAVAALAVGSNASNWITGPTVRVAAKDYYRQPAAKPPAGAALYVGLPVVLGFVAIMVCGTFMWNRKARKIGLGNIMSRRRGYGVGKSRAQRVFGKRGAKAAVAKEQAIGLMDRDRDYHHPHHHDDGVNANANSPYRDHLAGDESPKFGGTWDPDARERRAVPAADWHDDDETPRRDSDALGSLCESPTDDRPHHHEGERNAFRDEMSRQDTQRRHGDDGDRF